MTFVLIAAVVTLQQHYNTSHIFWDQRPSPHYQCCLQVSETASWRKLRCCYSFNMLQNWVGGRVWFISAKWSIPEFPETFPGIDLASIIHVRHCRCLVFSLLIFCVVASLFNKPSSIRYLFVNIFNLFLKTLFVWIIINFTKLSSEQFFKKHPWHRMILVEIFTWFDSSIVKQLELIYAVRWIFCNSWTEW